MLYSISDKSQYCIVRRFPVLQIPVTRQGVGYNLHVA